MSELNPKQEKFAQLYVKLSNASEAYRQAYNSKAKPESVHATASRILSEVKVTSRVEEIREALKADNGITLKNLLEELEEARKTALQSETAQCSAAVSATMSKAKLLGYDKPENRKDDDKALPLNITFDVRNPVADVTVTNAKP